MVFLMVLPLWSSLGALLPGTPPLFLPHVGTAFWTKKRQLSGNYYIKRERRERVLLLLLGVPRFSYLCLSDPQEQQ